MREVIVGYRSMLGLGALWNLSESFSIFLNNVRFLVSVSYRSQKLPILWFWINSGSRSLVWQEIARVVIHFDLELLSFNNCRRLSRLDFGQRNVLNLEGHFLLLIFCRNLEPCWEIVFRLFGHGYGEIAERWLIRFWLHNAHWKCCEGTALIRWRDFAWDCVILSFGRSHAKSLERRWFFRWGWLVLTPHTESTKGRGWFRLQLWFVSTDFLFRNLLGH